MENASKTVCFAEALQPWFREYTQQIINNPRALGEALKEEGLRMVTDGTDNHLMLVDLRPFNITGDVTEKTLDQAGITVNKNPNPYDPQPSKVTNGIRVGTPALTSRGFNLAEMEIVGALIGRVLRAPFYETELATVQSDVQDLTEIFSVPGILAESVSSKLQASYPLYGGLHDPIEGQTYQRGFTLRETHIRSCAL